MNTTNSSNGITNQDLFNDLGILKDNTNRIGLRHLDQTVTVIREKAPIPRGKLVNQLRIILLIQTRYVEEYIDGLCDLDVIRMEKGIIYWNYNGSEKK